MSAITSASLLCAGLITVETLTSPTPASANPALCERLDVQLANLARPRITNPREARRFDRAIAEQQQRLQQVTREARRSGCTGRLFEGRQCRQVNRAKRDMQNRLRQLQAQRNNLTEMVEDPFMRQRILEQMDRLNCRGQNVRYAGYGQQGSETFRRRGFFNWLFNGNRRTSQYDGFAYRTVCVRHYDGFFVPVSFATVPAFFADDASKCRSIWPEHESGLFVYTLPDQTLEDAVSVTGETRYMSLPNALRFQREYVDPDSVDGNSIGLNVTSITLRNQNGEADGQDAQERAEQDRETQVAALVGGTEEGDVVSDALPDTPGFGEATRRLTLQEVFIDERKAGGSENTSERTVIGFVPFNPHQDAIMGAEIPKALPGNENLPLANHGFRNVYEQPFVTNNDIASSASVQKHRYPPLPPRRPDTSEAS